MTPEEKLQRLLGEWDGMFYKFLNANELSHYTSGGAIYPLFLTNRDERDCDEIEKS